MKIGVVGAGRMGQALVTRLVGAGHDVMISNSRGSESLTGVVAAFEGAVIAGSVADATDFGEIVFVAIPVSAVSSLPAEHFEEKLVIDANNYMPQFGGDTVDVLDRDETTSSELLAQHLVGATVVKAFNTVFFGRLLEDSRPDLSTEKRFAIPISGDDESAKAKVLRLVDQMGFTGVDIGTLSAGRAQQPGSPLYAAFRQAREEGIILTEGEVRAFLAL